jgi:hypothetical protein
MEEFTRQVLTKKHKRGVTRCHIYLQAFYASDITYLTVKAIEYWAKQGKRQASRARRWNWPVQQRPTVAAWKTGNWYYKACHMHLVTVK